MSLIFNNSALMIQMRSLITLTFDSETAGADIGPRKYYKCRQSTLPSSFPVISPLPHCDSYTCNEHKLCPFASVCQSILRSSDSFWMYFNEIYHEMLYLNCIKLRHNHYSLISHTKKEERVPYQFYHELTFLFLSTGCVD